MKSKRMASLKLRSQEVVDVLESPEYEEVQEQIIEEVSQSVGEVIMETMDKLADPLEEMLERPLEPEEVVDVQDIATVIVEDALESVSEEMVGEEEKEPEESENNDEE